jgi:hypothetical protein
VLGVGVRAAAAAFRVAVEGLGGVVVVAVADATLAAAVDGVDCVATAFAPAVFDVLAARPAAGAAAAVDRRRVPPELGAVDPVDVSSVIAFSSSVPSGSFSLRTTVAVGDFSVNGSLTDGEMPVDGPGRGLRRNAARRD